MLRIIGTIVLLASVVGCESQYDKCFKAESQKIETNTSHPLVIAYSKFDEFGERTIYASRAWHEGYFSADPGPAKCETQDYPMDDECTAVFTAKSEAADNALQKGGFSDVKSAYDLLRKAMWDYELHNRSNDDFIEELTNFRNSYLEKFNDEKVQNDSNRQADLAIAQLKGEANIFIEDIKKSFEIVDSKPLAIEICNQRGLYE